MVEVAVALATAQAAVAGIKAAIQVGKDAKDCLGDFMKLFDAQDQVQRASTQERAKLKPAEQQQSAMSEALESVIAAKKIREMTDELKQYLIWSGQADIWDDIQREHNAIVQRRKAAELAAQREAERLAKQKRERALIATVIGTGLKLPVPSCPSLFEPQHFETPSARAQVWRAPALIASTHGLTVHQAVGAFLISGALTANGHNLNAGDALLISDESELHFGHARHAEVLLFDLAA